MWQDDGERERLIARGDYWEERSREWCRRARVWSALFWLLCAAAWVGVALWRMQ